MYMEIHPLNVLRITQEKLFLSLSLSPGRGEMTEVQPVLDFASSGRSGRRNALPDILGSPAGVNPSDLPLKLTELSLTGQSEEKCACLDDVHFVKLTFPRIWQTFPPQRALLKLCHLLKPIPINSPLSVMC